MDGGYSREDGALEGILSGGGGVFVMSSVWGFRGWGGEGSSLGSRGGVPLFMF